MIKTIKQNIIKFIVIFCVVISLFIIFRFNSKDTYTINISWKYNYISKQEAITLINNFKIHYLSVLKMNKNIKDIKYIEDIEDIKNIENIKDNLIELSLVVYDSMQINTIIDKLLVYINNNEYVLKTVAEQRKELLKEKEFIDMQINLFKLNKNVDGTDKYDGIYYMNARGEMLYFIKRSIEINYKLSKLQKAFELGIKSDIQKKEKMSLLKFLIISVVVGIILSFLSIILMDNIKQIFYHT